MNGTNAENVSLVIAGQLRRARLAIFTSRFLAGLFRWLSVNLALWGILMAGDMLLELPVELRLPMGVSGAAVTLLTFFKWLISPLRAFYDLDRTALELEKLLGIPRNLLINAFQLSRQQLSKEEQDLARNTIRLGLQRTVSIKHHDLLRFPRLLKGAGIALAIITLWLTAGIMLPSYMRYTLQRFYAPFADVPPPGRVVLTVIPDTNITVQEGADHSVALRVEPRGKMSDTSTDEFPPRIVIADTLRVNVEQGGSERGINMVPVDTQTGGPQTKKESLLFSHQFRDLRRSQSFRIFYDSGGTYTRSYQIQVQKNPEIVESEFRLTPPEYTGLTRTSVPGPPRNVSGLPESKLTVAIRLDTRTENMFWETHSETVAFTSDAGRYWTCETTIREASAYSIFTLPDARGQRMPIAAGNLLVERDQPPHVMFATDRLNREAWPGETINLAVIAEDDYGVSDVALSVTPVHAGKGEKTVVADWKLEGPPGEPRPDTLRVSHQLNPSDFTPGDDYLFTAYAGDFHPERQRGTSRPLLVRIRSMTELPDSHQTSSALEALQQAIIMQRRALSDTRTVANYMDAVLGRDPERPEFMFHHHRQQIETRQEQVYELLGIVVERAADPAFLYIAAVEKTRDQLVKPLVDDIRALSGDPEPWFANQNLSVQDDWPVLRFKPQYTRFTGIEIRNEKAETDIANIDFIDAEGQLVPPPYLDKYQLSPIYHEWDGPVGFVECDDSELQRITEAALQKELQGGKGPLLDLSKLVEGAPERNVALYAVRQIHCDKTRQVILWAGSSDSLRIWVNSKLAINRLARRAPAPDQERAILELNQGRNLLLSEVSAADRNAVLAMRFAMPDGTRLALRNDGRLEKVIVPKIAYAGGAPAYAVNAIDRNINTAWHVNDSRPCLLIVDIGHCREISGLIIHPSVKNKETAFKSYSIYTAEDLRIYDTLPPIVNDIAARQTEILDQLAAIRTAWLEHDEESVKLEEKQEETAPSPPAPAVVAGLRELVAELLDTSSDSIDLSKQRKSAIELYGDDFTEDITARLQEIKRSEQRLAHYLRDIVQDMSALGDLDLPAATQAANMQELVKKSALLADIAKEKAETPITHITDSLDTAEIELHEELQKQSEVAFGDTSRIQDVQEMGEDIKTPLPMAELPQTLSDLVGEMEEGLLEFDDEAQTIGSMLKALDADGPIGPGRMSSTSAEGKTGDEPPDAAREIEGRSGFGRTGRASGEGVANVAEDLPQDKGAAPPRDTGTSLEEGMVEDRSTEATAEATGLGKETDDTIPFGMGGSRLPPGLLERMRQTAGTQEDLRETVGRMILELRRHNLPSVKLNRAARAMDLIAGAAEEENFQQFTRAYIESMDYLYEAEEDIGRNIGLQYIRERRENIESKAESAATFETPEAYKDIVSEYFKALAEEGEE